MLSINLDYNPEYTSCHVTGVTRFLPAGRALRMRPANPKITLQFPRLYTYTYMYICTYHMRNNYVTYIAAMRPYFSRLRLLCIAAMSSLPQLRLRDGYREAEAM